MEAVKHTSPKLTGTMISSSSSCSGLSDRLARLTSGGVGRSSGRTLTGGGGGGGIGGTCSWIVGPVGSEVGLLEEPLVAAVYLDVLLVVEE